MILAGFPVAIFPQLLPVVSDIVFRCLIRNFNICRIVQIGKVCDLIAIPVIGVTDICQIFFGEDVMLVDCILCSAGTQNKVFRDGGVAEQHAYQ